MASGFFEWTLFSASALVSSLPRLFSASRATTLVLQLEQVGHVFLEAIGPEMRAGRRIDQLRVDAHAVLVTLHRAFEHVAHAEFLADLLGVDGLALEREGRVAGDDEAAADAREVGREILGDAVGEIVLGGSPERLAKGSTTMERCAASAGATAFEATGAGGFVATVAGRFATRKYQRPPRSRRAAPRSRRRAAPACERFFGSGGFAGGAGFACAGLPTSSE